MKANIFGVSCSVILMLLIGLSFMRKAHGQNGPAVNISDLPQHGIVLVGPADPQYDGMVRAMLKGQPSADVELLKPYSVFIHNRSPRTAVAYTVRWLITGANGQVIQHEITRQEPGALIGRRIVLDGSGGSGYSNVIGQGAFKFLSLASVGPGGGTMMGIRTEDPSSTARTPSSELSTLSGSRLGMIDKLREQFALAKSITIEVDGVCFEDGAFVGPNRQLSFDKLKASIDARQDLLREISILLGRGKPPAQVFDHVRAIAEGPQIRIAARSSPSDYYNRVKKIAAKELMSMRLALGDSALAMALEALRNPWPKLHKE